MVMSSGVIQNHHFILWLSIQEQLARVVRLKKSWVQVAQSSVLCNSRNGETLLHLCFECRYSHCMWQTFVMWLGLQRHILTWRKEVCWVARQVKKGKPRTKVIGWIFTALAYHMWERTECEKILVASGTRSIMDQRNHSTIIYKGQKFLKWKCTFLAS